MDLLQAHNGKLVAAQGGDVPFSDLDELSTLVKQITEGDKLGSKVRISSLIILY